MSQRATSVTPIAFVRAIVLAYERYGIDPSGALAQAHIAPRLLRQEGARISANQLETLSAAAMRELDDEALGWWRRRLPWGSYGMLARASLTAPDLGVALKRWFRHHALICDDVAITLETIPSQPAVVSLREVESPWPGTRELCLVTTLRNIHGYASWLIDSRVALYGAAFPFPAPRHAAAYPMLFGCPIEFDAQVASLRFDPAYLALPVRRDERAARAMLQRALPLTVHLYRRDRLLRRRVQDLLTREPSRMLNADALAAELHLSARTLHRQLREEGVSLQSLKAESRRVRAIDLLTRTQRPLKQIAQALGYSSAKSFARAFEQWTGQSPSKVRSHGAQ
jgi:AraC-like DNA-binding protein